MSTRDSSSKQNLTATLETVLNAALPVCAAINKSLLATRAKVRGTTKGTEDVTNVVLGLNTVSKGGVPSLENTLNNLDTGHVEVLERRLKATLVRVEQVVSGGSAGVGTVKVRGGAHDDDAGEVGQLVGRGAEEDFQGGVILLGAGAVVAGSVGQDLGGVLESGAEDVAAVVDIGGSDVALDNARGKASGLELSAGSLVVSTVGLGGGGVGEVGLAGEVGSDGAQVGVDLEDLGSVDAGRVLAWVFCALGDISGGVGAVQLADVDLILESDLDRVPSKGCGSSGGLLGTDAGDTGDEPVGLGEIEQGRESDRGDGGGGIDLGFTGDQLADLVVLGTVDIGEQGGEAGDGDVASQQVEFGDVPPSLSFRFELFCLSALSD